MVTRTAGGVVNLCASPARTAHPLSRSPATTELSWVTGIQTFNPEAPKAATFRRRSAAINACRRAE